MESESLDFQVLESIIKCVNFAAVKHKNQRRKDIESTPYINHPIGNIILRILSQILSTYILS